MFRQCIACGMRMETLSDFAASDDSNQYCKFCCREDGSMQSYDEKLESMSEFICQTKNISHDYAKELASNIMSHLPAWQNN